MHSLFLALSLLAAGPTAPVAPEPPRFEAPRFEPPPLPPLIAGKPSVEAPRSSETATPTPTTSGASAGQPPHPRDPSSTTPASQPSWSPAAAPGGADTPPGVHRDERGQRSTSTATQTPTPTAKANSATAHASPAAAATPLPKGAKAEPRAPEPTVLPPSLTPNALRDELRAASQRRQDELAAIARERARLEKLSTDIATARAGLESETARLDDKVKKAEAVKPSGPQQAPDGQSRGKPSGETLAKTLKGMKPDQAAALVSRLERRLAVNLLRQMRPADAGGVLEKMKPETAAELFALMASNDVGGPR